VSSGGSGENTGQTSSEARLDGKVAIITGATRGYGYTTARAFIGAGARVAIFARSEGSLKEAADSLGPAALPVPTDITDPDSVRRGFRKVREEFGRLDILVNNAVVGKVFKVEGASDDELRSMVGTNFLGPIYCSREAIPLMKVTGGGHIVNVSSETVRRPFPYLTVYAATKGGLEVFSTALREELQEDRIGVTLFRTGASSAVRDGSMRASGLGADWDPAVAAEVAEIWEKGGHAYFAGGVSGGMAPETVAASILHTVTRPDHANIDFVEIRAS
jgi:NADP-dependent 3-hydroxy acid dehydrogenase YdfG